MHKRLRHIVRIEEDAPARRVFDAGICEEKEDEGNDLVYIERTKSRETTGVGAQM